MRICSQRAMALFPMLAALVFTACVTDPETMDLSPFRAKWKRTEPAAYQYHVKRFCECTPEDVEVRATRDSVLSIREVGVEIQSPMLNRRGYSIDSLFVDVERALARKYAVRKVSFDPVYGFPDSVSIDFDRSMADEEFSLVISDFQPLTLTP